MWDDTAATFASMDKQAGDKPAHTCPDIDNLIDSLERLRRQNEQLRDYGRHWRDMCKDLDLERQNLHAQLRQVQQACMDMQPCMTRLTDALE